MKSDKLLIKVQRTHAELWNFLLTHIDHPDWDALKRHCNRLLDDAEKLRNMNDLGEYDFSDIRENRKRALKALKKIKESRKGKIFKTIKIGRGIWKEIEVTTK